MALSWKENYATLITAKTWDESVEGYKITNVLGLAWNYYLAYTKFITGLDLTMDMGMKIETFAANCYKLGYASEYKSNTYQSADMASSMFKIFESEALVAAASKKKVEAEQALIGKIQRTVASKMESINAEQVAGGTSTEEWSIQKTIQAPVFSLLCSTGATLAAGTGLAAFSEDGLALDGLIVELG
jgi:hypothetical protein